MRCHICNRRLNIDEVKQSRDGKWEPCTNCVQVAADLSTLVTSAEVEEYLIDPIFSEERRDDN